MCLSSCSSWLSPWAGTPKQAFSDTEADISAKICPPLRMKVLTSRSSLWFPSCRLQQVGFWWVSSSHAQLHDCTSNSGVVIKVCHCLQGKKKMDQKKLRSSKWREENEDLYLHLPHGHVNEIKMSSTALILHAQGTRQPAVTGRGTSPARSQHSHPAANAGKNAFGRSKETFKPRIYTPCCFYSLGELILRRTGSPRLPLNHCGTRFPFSKHCWGACWRENRALGSV